MRLELRRKASAAGFWVIVALVIGAWIPAAAEGIGPDEIPGVLISAASEKAPDYAVIVEKSRQNLYLYRFGPPAEIVLRMPCSTGEVRGAKARSGDKKTPEGVYFFIKEHLRRDLAPIYGSRAFPLDYPNLMDRISERDGNSIWMHGTNKPLKPRDSNGCVALQNNDIDRLAEYITLNRTPIIIVDRMEYSSAAAAAGVQKSLEAFLADWKTALENGSYHDYLTFYDDAYLPDISWWPAWRKLRESLPPSDLPLQVDFKNIMLLKHKALYVALFDQIVQTADAETVAGTRKLFLTNTDNRFHIVGDAYQVLPDPAGKDLKASEPIVTAALALSDAAKAEAAARQKEAEAARAEAEAAARRKEEVLSARRKPEAAAARQAQSGAGRQAEADTYRLSAVMPEDDFEIQEMADGWLKAWSSKDIEAYGDYYAENFRSEGGGARRAWLAYKNRLNRRYTYIHVTRGDLSVKKRKSRLLVSFIQKYESNSFKTAGTKQLVLIRENGRWKIYREIWQKE